jgi:hypothetical protein
MLQYHCPDILLLLGCVMLAGSRVPRRYPLPTLNLPLLLAECQPERLRRDEPKANRNGRE